MVSTWQYYPSNTTSIALDCRSHSLPPSLPPGSVVISAITSCTNTSNPSVMLGAGLLAKKAVERGLTVALYIKTSLSPGSGVVTYYLRESGVIPYLQQLGLVSSLLPFLSSLSLPSSIPPFLPPSLLLSFHPSFTSPLLSILSSLPPPGSVWSAMAV